MGVVICYDISDKATFSNVEHWIGQINQQGDPAVRKMLTGNKSDLDSNLRQVTSEEVENLAARYNMKFFETSAKSGDGVYNAFASIADEVVAHRQGSSQAQPGQKVSLGSNPKSTSKGCCK